MFPDEQSLPALGVHSPVFDRAGAVVAGSVTENGAGAHRSIDLVWDHESVVHLK